MSRRARLVRLVVGADVEPALRPVLAVSFAVSVAGSSFWSYMAIWAIKDLGASSRELAFGFLLGAAGAMVTGYVGGHLSDHLGRRRLMLVGEGALCVMAPTFLLVDENVALGLGLMALTGSFASLGGSVGQALVADLLPERGSLGVIRRDRLFLVFLASSLFAWLVYVAYELPFLLFGIWSAIPVIVLVIVLFVVGEMLWVPTSQSVVAGLAPDDLRGTYMGAAAFALAPFTGLQVRGAYGDDAMWAMFASISIVSALLGAVACHGVRRAGAARSAVLET